MASPDAHALVMTPHALYNGIETFRILLDAIMVQNEATSRRVQFKSTFIEE